MVSVAHLEPVVNRPQDRKWYREGAGNGIAEALKDAFPGHDLDFAREVEIDIHYKEAKIGHIRVDFVVEDVLVEIKAKSALEPVDVSQTLSYLKASGYQVALLLNFGTSKLGIKRLIMDR